MVYEYETAVDDSDYIFGFSVIGCRIRDGFFLKAVNVRDQGRPFSL